MDLHNGDPEEDEFACEGALHKARVVDMFDSFLMRVVSGR